MNDKTKDFIASKKTELILKLIHHKGGITECVTRAGSALQLGDFLSLENWAHSGQQHQDAIRAAEAVLLFIDQMLLLEETKP